MTKKQPTFEQLKNLLEDCELLLSKLDLPEANFMIPTDGKGMRIRVSAPKQQCDPGNKTMDLEIPGGEIVAVDFEICDDFEPVELRASKQKDQDAN